MTKNAMMIIQKISEVYADLADRFTVKRIGVFGSCVRGEERPDSDVDVLVDLGEPTFDHYMDLKFKLEELLRRPVDLVLRENLKPCLRSHIEQEVVYA